MALPKRPVHVQIQWYKLSQNTLGGRDHFTISSSHCSNLLNRHTIDAFEGENFYEFRDFFSHPRKFSPRNSGHATPIMRPAFRESFLREMLLSYRSAKVFSLKNFPLYGIWLIMQSNCSLIALSHAWHQERTMWPGSKQLITCSRMHTIIIIILISL